MSNMRELTIDGMIDGIADAFADMVEQAFADTDGGSDVVKLPLAAASGNMKSSAAVGCSTTMAHGTRKMLRCVVASWDGTGDGKGHTQTS